VFAKEDGTYDGYCFSCGKYVPDPYKNNPGYKPVFKKKTEEEVQRELEDIEQTFKTLPLEDRGINEETASVFGVKVAVSEEDGVTPTAHYYPYFKEGVLKGYKVRVIENKRMWAVGDCKDVDLFGWEQAKSHGAKRLYITEGECDAMALFQIFKTHNKNTQYEKFNPAIVSIPHGASSAAKDLAKLLPEIRKFFKEIVLVFDQDDAGKRAVEEVLRTIPDALTAALPCKDVNECLQSGKSKACYNAVVFNSSKPKNTRLVSARTLHESAKKTPEWGYSWPWKHLSRVTRGIRLGETIYIGAGQKQGKSEVVNTLAAHFIKEHGWKVFLVKPEEANVKTYKMVAGKMVGKFFHDPSKPFDEEAFEKAGGMIGDNLFMLDLYQHIGFESLKADIRAAAMEGCKAIFIDPITNLVNGLDSGQQNTKLQEIAQELSALALDLDVVIFIFCHLRNPDSGPPHERGGEVLSSQFAGSRAMARSCNLMLGLEGNRDPNITPEERNIRTLVLLEDRENGEVGRFRLYWNNVTGLFEEINV
jgi:twinkle protein